MDQRYNPPTVAAQDVQILLEAELNLTVETAETDLIETGVLDSLLFVDLIMLLESKFNIVVDINEIEFEDFMSVRSICRFVERKITE